MALASAYGLSYNLPQDSMAQRPIRGGINNQQQGLDFGQDDLLNSDLYVKEGATEEYYKKVAALKSFANEVSSRYGYDVTRPNYRDPDSIRFHRAYLESLADLQATQNELKRLGQQENVAIQNPNVQMQTFEDGTTRAVNRGENDMVRSLRDTAARVKSREGAEDFSEVKNMLIEQLEEELASSTDNRERAELASTLQQVKNINPDVGISDAQQAQLEFQRERAQVGDEFRRQQLAIQRQRANQSGSGARPTQATIDAQGRIRTMVELTEPDKLESIGLKRVDTATGTYLERTDGKGRVKVDGNNPETFVNNINRLLNEDKSTTSVGMDRLMSLGINVNEFGGALAQTMNPQQDISGEVLNNVAQIIQSLPNNRELGQKLVELLEAGSEVPSDVARKFPGKKLEGQTISKINYREPKIFRGHPGNIEVTLSNGAVKDLNLNNEEDVQIFREILDHNMNYIDRDKVQIFLPQTMVPQAGGMEVEEDDDISFDDF